MSKKQTIGQVAAKYLREHGHESVMWGDTIILHDIAEAAGLPQESSKTIRRVMNALDRSPELTKLYVKVRLTTTGGGWPELSICPNACQPICNDFGIVIIGFDVFSRTLFFRK
jgi:hypothetical protein